MRRSSGAPLTRPDASDALILRSPDAVVAAIPYLLGFVPTDSIVVVWIGGRRVVLTQRLDLPPTQADVPGWLSAMWAHAAVDMADEIIVVLVTERDEAGDLVRAVSERAFEAGIAVRDALRTSGDRWWSLLCHDSECCPTMGRSIDASVVATVSAEFTVQGVAPLPTRDHLVLSLAADPIGTAAVRRALEVLGTTRARRGARREEWRDRVIDSTLETLRADECSTEEAALIIYGLADIRVRDTVLWEAGRLEQAGLQRAMDRLADVIRTAPSGYVAPVAASYGVMAWLAGDGARALIGADRAMADDAEYSLALLVVASLRAGLPPDGWRTAMRAMPRSECRRPAVTTR